MAFAPTPPRSNAPSQLLSLSAILATTGGSGDGSGQASASVGITSQPTTGVAGTVLELSGTVAPGGTAVQVGLSTSASVAPTSWSNATVDGAGWTASVSPSSAGTFYIWAEQTNTSSVQAVSAAIAISSSGTGSVSLSAPPTTGMVGTGMTISGTVSPSGSAVRVGLSNSTTVAPASWTNATVNATQWTASLTASAAGTYYIWAEQTNTPSNQAISAVITVTSGSAGSPLTYSLISGSGNASLVGVTLSNGTTYTVDWTSSITHGATDVRPGVVVSSLGDIAACKFWFDTSATNTTVPTTNYGNAGSLSNDEINFYANNTGYGTPTAAPAAPTATGTYYGKYAMYDSSNTLLGIFATSAITII